MAQRVGDFGDAHGGVGIIGGLVAARVGDDSSLAAVAIGVVAEAGHCPGGLGEAGHLVGIHRVVVGKFEDVAGRVGELGQIIAARFVGVGGGLPQRVGGSGQIPARVIGVQDLASTGIGDGGQLPLAVVGKGGRAALRIGDRGHLAVGVVVRDLFVVLVLVIDEAATAVKLVGFLVLVEIQVVGPVTGLFGQRGVEAGGIGEATTAIGREEEGRTAGTVVGDGAVAVELQVDIRGNAQGPVLAEHRVLIGGGDRVIETLECECACETLFFQLSRLFQR